MLYVFALSKSTNQLKPYIFAHPNPINAIISWIISWTISWQIIPYHTKQKDGYSFPTNSPTYNLTNWIWMSKNIGLKSVCTFG